MKRIVEKGKKLERKKLIRKIARKKKNKRKKPRKHENVDKKKKNLTKSKLIFISLLKQNLY